MVIKGQPETMSHICCLMLTIKDMDKGRVSKKNNKFIFKIQVKTKTSMAELTVRL